MSSPTPRRVTPSRRPARGTCGQRLAHAGVAARELLDQVAPALRDRLHARIDRVGAGGALRLGVCDQVGPALLGYAHTVEAERVAPLPQGLLLLRVSYRSDIAIASIVSVVGPPSVQRRPCMSR